LDLPLVTAGFAGAFGLLPTGSLGTGRSVGNRAIRNIDYFGNEVKLFDIDNKLTAARHQHVFLNDETLNAVRSCVLGVLFSLQTPTGCSPLIDFTPETVLSSCFSACINNLPIDLKW